MRRPLGEASVAVMTRSRAGSRTFFAECLASPAHEASVVRERGRLRLACMDVRTAGTAIEYLGALLVPEDELILHMFVSAGPEVVRHVSQRAAIRVERIVEAVAIGPRPSHAVLVPVSSDPARRESFRARGAGRRR